MENGNRRENINRRYHKCVLKLENRQDKQRVLKNKKKLRNLRKNICSIETTNSHINIKADIRQNETGRKIN